MICYNDRTTLKRMKQKFRSRVPFFNEIVLWTNKHEKTRSNVTRFSNVPLQIVRLDGKNNKSPPQTTVIPKCYR